MSTANTFGRRQPPSPRVAPCPVPPRSATAPATRSALSPRAEAFRAEIAAQRAASGSAFDRWRRARGGRRWLVWAVTLLSLSPGLVSFLIDAPLPVSAGLEAAAVAGNIWLRRERRRRLREIATWQEPAGLA